MANKNISITSKIDDKIIVTQLDLELKMIYVTEDKRFIYNGDIAGFKRKVGLKADSRVKQVYEELLSLAEEIESILSSN